MAGSDHGSDLDYHAWDRGNLRGPKKGRLLGQDAEGNDVYALEDGDDFGSLEEDLRRFSHGQEH